MARKFAHKLVFLPALIAILAVIGIFGAKTLATNDIVTGGKLWKPGLAYWEASISVEPGMDFKITLYASNFSSTETFTNLTITDQLPQYASYIPASTYQLDAAGAWQAFADDGTSPFDGAGMVPTSGGTLAPFKMANFKYAVHADDFLPTGTTALAWSGPALQFTDAFGSHTINNVESVSIGVTNLPTINSVALAPAVAAYKLGDVITVTIAGTPGKTAYLKIGSININLVETASGTYTGSYTVQTGDNLSAATPRAYLVNANAKGAFSDYSQSITMDSTLPPAPSGLSAVLNPDNTVTLAWIAPGVLTDVGHFNIYSNNGSGNVNFATPVTTVVSTATQYTTTVLTADALYKFAVQAADASGNTDGNINIVSKSTDVTPPESPAALVQPTTLNTPVLQFSNSQPIQFIWASSPASDLVRYRVEIDDNSDFSSIITSQETVGTSTSYTLQTSTIALPEGIYFWRVSAIDDADLVSIPATAPDNSFEIDNTAATILVTQPTSGSQVGATFTTTGTANDAGAHLGGTTGIQKVEVFLTNFTTGQHWNGTAWQAGSIFLTVASTDNFATWSYQFSGAVANNNSYFTGARITDKAGHQTDSSLVSLAGDTIVPAVGSVTITNSTLGSTTAFKNGQSIVLTATITDNLGQASMGTGNISADLSAITGNAADNAVAPATYNTTTGLATWAAVAANTSSDGAKTATVTALDVAVNSGTGNNSITADNSVPTINTDTLTGPSTASVAWAGGSTKNITWDSADITDANLATNPITLEYSIDGSTWTQIATNEANDGTYAWAVPALNSTTVQVRLGAKDNAGNIVYDTSDNNFTIDSLSPTFANTILTNSTMGIATFVKNGDTVVLTSDISDNLLQGGMTQASFTANFSAITGNPADNAVAPASYNPATGAAVWNFKTVSGAGNGDLSLSITATDLAGNAATFTNTSIITADNSVPTIAVDTLTGPTIAGVTWAGSSTHNITWDNTDIADANLAVNPITLEYSTDGSTWTQIATNEANDGTYSWALPALNSQTVKIKVTATDKAGNIVSDISDNNFTIDSTVPTVTAAALIAPNGNEAWKQGTSRNITWDDAAVTDNFALAVNPITLEYTTDGSNWTQIATDEANDGTYAWTTPIMDSTTVRVRLIATDAAGLTNSDMSDLTFSIGLPPTIVQARAMNNTLIEVEFDKALSGAGAFANYTATGITATAAALNGGNNKIVDLTVNALNNTGFTAADLAVALNTVTDTFNFQNEAASGQAIIDKQAPQTSIASSYPNSNQLIVDFSANMRVAVSEAPGAATVFKLDTATKVTLYNATDKVITFTPAAPLAAGKHTISLDLVDLAGNTEANQTWNFWIDSFSMSTTLAPISLRYNGNLSDETDVAERQQITVSTFGAGFKVYAFFQPDFGDGFGNFITDVDAKLAADLWASKIDLNRTTQVQLVSVAKAALPSDTAVNTTYTYDLRATLPSLIQAAGAYQGTLQFIVVPEY